MTGGEVSGTARGATGVAVARDGTGGARFSAEDCARALGQPHLPTAEQVAVIEAPLAPLLVVAGAGSGKTETMAARVVWLVANGLVEPDEVLGLTFTRKAAGELGERLGARLTALRAAGIWTPPSHQGAEPLNQVPLVSTYHSYAGRIVREHGTRLGVEADSRLLTEAAAWQFAHEAVVSHDGPMTGVTKAESTVTTAVVDLAGELAEHLVTVDRLDEHLEEVIGHLGGLVKGEGDRGRGLPPVIRDTMAALSERRAILPILERYAALKRSRDAMDFADQMAVAAELARSFPDVGAQERSRFKVVLLDEFQDTSEAQLQLLRALFAPDGLSSAVTAVGDPHQSIYGWRGASSTTLRQFVTDFGGAEPARVLPLSTSWRNDRQLLQVANEVAGPLRAGSLVPVAPLAPRPGAGRGHVSLARLATMEDEATHVVDWLLERRQRPDRRTAAILCRKRSQFDPIIAALDDRGVPYEVVGLGGLLHTPEVADLVALLWVVQDPSRGDHLMRLLTGARCRLGTADLDAFAAWARHLSLRARSDTVPRHRRLDLEPSGNEDVTLVEALTDLPPAQWTGRDGEWLTDDARDRLGTLSLVIQQLRSLTGGGLAELVATAEAALGLEVEVLARPGWSVGVARAHLDAFHDVASAFDAAADRPTLGGFLSWLDAAIAEERGLDLGWIETSPDAVQVMTVHAAKGLEWDVVAVPGLIESSFPAHSANQSSVDAGRWQHPAPNDRAWLGGLAGLPHDLRGDRAALPRFAWDALVEWGQSVAAHQHFLRESADRGIAEERRLAYVAVTRARTDLLLSAHVWGTAKSPRITSRFLEEVKDSGLADRVTPWVDLPPVDEVAENPRLAEEVVVPWPPEPSARARELWSSAAEAVRESTAQQQGSGRVSTVRLPDDWRAERAILLAERDADRSMAAPTMLPSHLSTSDVVALAADPTAFALRLRRPMPQPPAQAARIGTAFHAWVERHYARAAILDVAELPGAEDDEFASEDLAALQAHFLASHWADLDPLELEVAVETTLGDVAVRGRIDAVFPDPDDPDGFVILDWKTGAPPPPGVAAHRAIQLASYRTAWCRLRGVDPERVRAGFFHAATGETTWPELPGPEQLEALLGSIPAVVVSGSTPAV